jgi:DNA-binding transcriptional ArsR family regulator
MSAIPVTATTADTYREVDIAPTASLMADSARAAMLTALLDDRPLAAGELARVAGVTPATASAHLARLLHGGLVEVQRQGRHRYYRLAGHEVAHAIEALAHLSPAIPVRSLRQSQLATALGSARTCYDHLAGQAGVALFAALLSRGIVIRLTSNIAPQARAGQATLDVSARGELALRSFGIEIEKLRASRRRFAGECLDWTERRPHLNGALGAALTDRCFELGWIERGRRRRAVTVTPAGREGLAATFGWAPAG